MAIIRIAITRITIIRIAIIRITIIRITIIRITIIKTTIIRIIIIKLGHGTHVAGIIGSHTYGIAKGIKLVGLKSIGCEGIGKVSDILRAISWILENATKPYVVTFSLGM
jgi:hypothetical protein